MSEFGTKHSIDDPENEGTDIPDSKEISESKGDEAEENQEELSVDQKKKEESKLALIKNMNKSNEMMQPELEEKVGFIERIKDLDKETKKALIGFLFGVISPLFLIFSFNPFSFEGIYLPEMIVNMLSDPLNILFEWVYCLFKGNLINLLFEYGIVGLLIPPLLPTMLTWLIVGYLIGVFIKSLKKSMISIILVITFYFITFLVLMFLNNSMLAVFSPNLIGFFGGILGIAVFSIAGGILGNFSGN